MRLLHIPRRYPVQVTVIENVLKLNDEIAAMNRRTLRDAGVFAIDLIGGPG